MKIWINKGEIENLHSSFHDSIIFDMLDESPKSNLKVDFETIWRRFGKDYLGEIYEDLITIAASVYVSDKRVPRSSAILAETGDNWTRRIHISIPVLELDKWKYVKKELEEVLDFLSGDLWELDFRKTEIKFGNSSENKKYNMIEGKFDAVSLFSGGLDSFSGAINLLEKGKDICFVGCREYFALGKRIDNLFHILKEDYPKSNMDIIIFKADPGSPRNINEDMRGLYNENTSRSRSLLFLSIAVAVASLVGNEVPVYIPENGFIGLNIPLTPSRMGSCSTRTTHLHFIKGFNEILQKLGIPHKVENFFAYKTKGEIVHSVKETKAFKRGAGETISCSHPMRADKGIPGRPRNCGYCYPCLIRRASLNGIQVQEEYLEKFKEEYRIGLSFIENERFSNPDTGKTADLKAVLFSLYNYLKHRNREYYIEKLIVLGGMNLEDIEKFVDVYMKSMEELHEFIRNQAEANGMELLEFIGDSKDE